jgi:DNA-binding NarL/FixJ family response regulator
MKTKQNGRPADGRLRIGETKSIKIVVVDDHELVLEGLKSLLVDEFNLVGGATSGLQAISLVDEQEPDVVVMDVRLPDVNGLECMRRMRVTHPELKVILLTAFESDLYLVEALRWGVNGYLLKDTCISLISHAIRAATRGGCLLPESLLAKAFGALARAAVNLPRPAEENGLPRIVTLTPRELDVLRHLSRGSTNREIAEQLHLAEVTVKKHVQSILSKMGVKDRIQAALQGVRLGLVD